MSCAPAILRAPRPHAMAPPGPASRARWANAIDCALRKAVCCARVVNSSRSQNSSAPILPSAERVDWMSGQQLQAQTAAGASGTRCDACRKPLVRARTRPYRARASSSSSSSSTNPAKRRWCGVGGGQQVHAQTAAGAVATRCDACRKLLLPSLATPPAARAPPVCLYQIPLHAG